MATETGGMVTESYYQLDGHVNPDTWGEWGSAPRGPLLALDMSHRGELMDSVIGLDPATMQQRVYHILRCELCIITHAWPLPSEDALAQYYATQFYQVTKPDYVARSMADRAWWEQCTYEPLLKQALSLVDTARARNQQQLRFLDIGAGSGISLDVAKRMGFEAWGLEPNPVMVDQLRERKHHAIAGTLTATMCQSMQRVVSRLWDVLCLYETLDHQPNPEDFLLNCYELLAPGGILICAVPNDWNPLQLQACKELKLARWWLSAPDHLHYFTPKTLQLLVRRSGYNIRDMRTTYPLEQHLLMGDVYVGNDAVGRRVHQERMKAELAAVQMGNWPTLEAQYRANMTERIGRELICVAQKPA